MSAARGGRTARAAGAARSGTDATASGPSAPGAVVAVCTGHRCAGLRRLVGQEDLDDGLKEAVRSSSGGVLLSCPCVGRCEHGPVTVVGHHPGAARGTGGEDEEAAPTVWLTESDDPRWRGVLRTWVAQGAATGVRVREDGRSVVTGVPAALRAAVVGCSTGGPLRRLDGPPGPGAGS